MLPTLAWGGRPNCLTSLFFCRTLVSCPHQDEAWRWGHAMHYVHDRTGVHPTVTASQDMRRLEPAPSREKP